MTAPVELFTIGFTRKSAEAFFTSLREAGVRRLVDVRLNNISQLAGFAKKEDLRYFLRAIAGIEYLHLGELAPTQEMLDIYKKSKGSWEDYAARFNDLIAQRQIETTLRRDVMDGACLLCSEDTPLHCHRRLVAEYLERSWGQVTTKHLK